MLKTSGSTESLIQPGESVVGFDDDSRAKGDANKLDGSKVDGGEVEVDEIGKKV